MQTQIDLPKDRWGRGLRWCVGVALALSVALPVRLAGAQAEAPGKDASKDAEARELFQAGEVAFEGGRFEAALSRWQEAYALSSRPALQYNIGLALDRLRRDEEAIEAFRSYLTWDSKGERADEVRGRIEALEKASVARRAALEQATAEAAAAQARSVATPAEAAATVATDASSAGPPVPEAGRGSSLTQQWWFWPAVGVLAAGALAGVIAASSAGEEVVEAEAPVIARSTRISALRQGATP